MLYKCLLPFTLACLLLSGCGQTGPLTLPETNSFEQTED